MKSLACISLNVFALMTALLLAVLFGPSSVFAQDGFCGFDVADACTRQLGVAWKEGPKTSFLENEPVTSMADLKYAFEELDVEVFATAVNTESLPIVRRIFVDQGVVGIIRVESEDAAIRETGIGHFLMVTGFASSDEMVAYDATTQEVRNVRYLGPEDLPILLVSTQKISLPSVWKTLYRILADYFSSFGLTAFLASGLIGMVVVSLYPKLLQLNRRVLRGAAVILVIALVGFVGYQVYRNQTSQTVGFEKSIYALGRFKVGAKALGVAKLVNKFNHPVQANLLTASCNCMAIDFTPQSIPAGQTLEIPVEFASVSPGLSRYSITLDTDFGTSTCQFQMVGESSLSVLPKSALAGAISLSDPQPIVHRLTIVGKTEAPAPINDIVALENAPFTIQEFKGDVAVDGATVDIYIVANENSRTGVQFSKFRLLTQSAGEPLAIEFDIGVEFK